MGMKSRGNFYTMSAEQHARIFNKLAPISDENHDICPHCAGELCGGRSDDETFVYCSACGSMVAG